MKTAQKLARYGATLALALALVATTAPSLAFATDEYYDENGNDNEQHGEYESEHDPNSAPFVLTTVNGGIQTAAGATGFGLGTAAAASGEEGLGIAAEGTGVGAAITDLGIGIPTGIVSQP